MELLSFISLFTSDIKTSYNNKREIITTKYLHKINEEVLLISGVSRRINITQIHFEPSPLIHKCHSSHVFTSYTCTSFKLIASNPIKQDTQINNKWLSNSYSGKMATNHNDSGCSESIFFCLLNRYKFQLVLGDSFSRFFSLFSGSPKLLVCQKTPAI